MGGSGEERSVSATAEGAKGRRIWGGTLSLGSEGVGLIWPPPGFLANVRRGGL